MLPAILLDKVMEFAGIGISGICGIASSVGGSESFCKIAILCRTAVATNT